MMFNVPQFIDVEDKIAGPLTWRQLLWMIGLGAVLLVLFNFISGAAFFVAAVPIVLIFCALAFYRPNNQPLVLYAIQGVMFLFRPKIAVWERPTRQAAPKPVEPEKAPDSMSSKEKKVTMNELKDLAALMDRRGRV